MASIEKPRQQSAGLRTYTLVGFGAALFMLVSKYGFGDILDPRTVVLDPSRIAAQIVTGIGFIGGGLIFVRRDAVRRLTTAAAVWLTAGVGMACGAGLPILAIAATGGYFFIVFAYTPVVRRLPGSGFTLTRLRLEYLDKRGVLRRALEACTTHGFAISDLAVTRGGEESESRGRDQRRNRTETGPTSESVVQVTMTAQGLATSTTWSPCSATSTTSSPLQLAISTGNSRRRRGRLYAGARVFQWLIRA